MNQPKTITVNIGGKLIEIEPITSPGPCSICGKPANGLSCVGGGGREWQLCGDGECSSKALTEQEEHMKTGPR